MGGRRRISPVNGAAGRLTAPYTGLIVGRAGIYAGPVLALPLAACYDHHNTSPIRRRPMSANLPVTRVVLYKHGVGYFEREGSVDGDAVLALTFKQREVADVLKSLTVLDLHGGQVTSVSYDSTRPLEQ